MDMLEKVSADERGGDNLNELKSCLKNGSRQGQNLAVTVLFVRSSLDSGMVLQPQGTDRKGPLVVPLPESTIS